MSKGYIFMRIFKCKRDAFITIIKYFCLFVLVFVCGFLYSCQGKNNSSNVKLELSGDQFQTEEDDKKNNVTVDGDMVKGDETVDTTVMICVHITGYVANPGVYDVRSGARIYEVVRLAGGFLPEADESYLNLASMVTDGQKIIVLSKDEAKTAKPYVDSSENETAKKLININTATKEELMQLSGIGESRALSIIAYREKNGGFKKISDIMNVAGIKEAAFEKIKDSICTE